MSDDTEAEKGLNILCIDAGGICGLSSLFLIEELLNRLQGLNGSQMHLKPVDHFDVIAGTGTGGIIACMLGRLGMSMGDAIEAYLTLAKHAFSRKYIGTGRPTAYRGTKLQEALSSMILNATGNEADMMKAERRDRGACKTVVFAMPSHNLTGAIPVLFRSYDSPVNNSLDCTIWEALYATMAHPELFKAIYIADGLVSQSFVGGELGCSNPTAHVLNEVRNIYPDRQVSCIISVGTGVTHVVHIPDPSPSERILRASTRVSEGIKNVSSDSERVAEEMATRFRHTQSVYYRFNVDQGMQMIEDDWQQGHLVKTYTTTYTKKVEASQMFGQAAQAVKERKNVLSVKCIDGSIQISFNQTIVIKSCPMPTPVFTGRNDQLQQVGNCITGNISERRVCVVYGMGGSGKTQLVLKAIERSREIWKYIIYVDAVSREAIEGALRDFAKATGFGQTYSDTLRWLGSCREPWLLVLDSADHPLLSIHEYFPPGDLGGILITTRRPTLSCLARGPGSVCLVSEMSCADGLALFLKVAQIHDQDIPASEMAAARALLEVRSRVFTVQRRRSLIATVQDFGYLALAIVQAGAYIAYSQDLHVSEYRERFLVQRQRMLEQYIELEALAKFDGYGKSVSTTWQLCYDLLQKNGDARATLWLIAYLHHDDIRKEIFRRAAINVLAYEPVVRQTELEREAMRYMREYLGRFIDRSGRWDATRFSNAINELASYSLVEFDHANQGYRVHVLVQEWARTSNHQPAELALECATLLLSLSVDWLDTTESLAFTRKLRGHLEGILPKSPSKLGVGHATSFQKVYTENGNWDKAEALQIQIVEVMKEELGEEFPRTLWSMDVLANTYRSRGLWDKARSLHQHVLNARRRVLGNEHPDTLASMNNLASTHESQGQLGKAEPLHEQVLDARKRVLGEEHPDTLMSMSNLASTYRSRGQWDKAEPLHEQVLNARKDVLGEEHPATLGSMNNLALIYQSRGQWDKAELLHKKALSARKRILGEEHPDTLMSMNNLAVTYQSQGQWDKAESLNKQVMNGFKKLLGEEHPNTLISMNSLANAYRSRGHWDDAQSLHEQVLNTRKRVLGEEHPDTLMSMNNLASTYQSRGQWDKAQPLHEQALDARKRVLGEEHPHSLESMNDLALLYQSRGQWNKAESLHEKALSARKRVLGGDHPSTLMSMNNLAVTYQSWGQWDKARSLHVQAMSAFKKLLGGEHPNTLTSMNNLANAYQSRGQWDKAQSLQEQVLNAQKRVLGEEHPDTLGSMNNLANTYRSQRQWDMAQSLHARVLDARKRVLGKEHPDTLISMNNLAGTYRSWGKWDKAVPLYEKALAARKKLLGQEHPDTLISMNNLALTYQSRGQWDKAKSLHEHALEAFKRVLGEEHPDTLMSMNNLSYMYAQLGRLDESEQLAAAVDARKHIVGTQHQIAVWARKHIEWLKSKNVPAANSTTA